MYFAYDKKESEKQNWTSKLESIRKSLRWWNTRDLSLKGRILIIKSTALAKVVYLTGALHTPNWVINEINKEFFGFVWKFKRDKVARKVLVNTVDNGGLNMIDFKSFCISMKANWATQLFNNQKILGHLFHRNILKIAR